MLELRWVVRSLYKANGGAAIPIPGTSEMWVLQYAERIIEGIVINGETVYKKWRDIPTEQQE